MQAARYWGMTQAEYYQRADVWPLAPQGEIFVVLQIEDTAGIGNLPDILANVPGIGAVLIGEGDLSQELGYPRQTEHKAVLDAMAQVVSICRRHDVIVGHPHVTPTNAERVIAEGYRYLMCGAPRSFASLEHAREAAGRA
jgi:4-hydroxy-2-oxoheptanedioate aldolase